jgi:hypothetical protein
MYSRAEESSLSVAGLLPGVEKPKPVMPRPPGELVLPVKLEDDILLNV